MASEDHAQLFLRLRAGDPEALGEVGRLYGPEVHRILRAKHPEVAGVNASDLLQTILTRMLVRGDFDKLGDLNHEGVVPFLVRNAQWKQIDKYRQRQRRENAELQHAHEQDGQHVAAGEPLDELIGRLDNDADRKLIELRSEGYSFEEIAKVLNKSPGTLRKQYERLKKRIRSQSE